MTSRITGGLSDPFHFYYAFTFGTSYAVVGLLAIKGYIGPPEIAIVVGYGLVFLVGYRSFSRVSTSWLYRTVRFVDGGQTFFHVALVIYSIVAIIYVMFAGLPFLSTNRFETNQGFFTFVRVMDPLRLFIVGYLAIRITNRKRKNRFWLGCGTVVFMIISSLLNGAKFALLETAYVAAVAIAISSHRKALPNKKIIWPAIAVLFFATIYALVQLFFNFHEVDSSASAQAQYITGTPLVIEQFSIRIISNGDMYFMGLPPAVLHSLRVEHPIAQLFGPILGGGPIPSLLGYQLGPDIGEQIKLYWNPFTHDLGGPTDHFDLVAYVYFGPLLGVLFVMCLALLLAQITRLKQNWYSATGCSVVATLYCSSLPLLLNPSAGLLLIVDVFAVFAIVTVFAKILKTATLTKWSLIPPLPTDLE
jgi:hypothetical protein